MPRIIQHNGSAMGHDIHELMRTNKEFSFLVMNGYKRSFRYEYCGTKYESYLHKKKEKIQCKNCGADIDVQKLIHEGIKIDDTLYTVEDDF